MPLMAGLSPMTIVSRTAVSLLQPRPRISTKVLVCRESTFRDLILTMEVLHQLSYVGVAPNP
jgi:hypothetical protein